MPGETGGRAQSGQLHFAEWFAVRRYGRP
jgi:hypothetical protein